MKRIGHDSKFGDRPLEPERAKQGWATEHCQSIERVVPERMITAKGLKRFKNRINLLSRIFLAERRFHFPDQIAKSDWVLLIFGMPPMGRLVEREARRLMNRGQLG